LVLLGVLALTGCGTGEIAPPVSLDPVGERPPLEAFRLPALIGDEPVEIDGGEGPLIINFWASWCGPCRAEMPDLDSLARERDDVTVVGLLHDDTAGAGRAFAAELGLEFTLADDPDGEVYDRFGATGLPVTVFVDGEGRVASRWFGRLDRATLDAFVDQL
jgi:thiol-disulfide isomerase/thioredoxin